MRSRQSYVEHHFQSKQFRHFHQATNRDLDPRSKNRNLEILDTKFFNGFRAQFWKFNSIREIQFKNAF